MFESGIYYSKSKTDTTTTLDCADLPNYKHPAIEPNDPALKTTKPSAHFTANVEEEKVPNRELH